MNYTIPYWVTKSISDKEELLLFNWKNNKSAIIFEKNHPAYALNNSAELHLNSSISSDHASDINWLCEYEFLSKNKETKPFKQDQKKLNANSLHLILLPAGEACNLDCVYCYEDHSYKKRMNEELAINLIKFIENKNPSELNIEYFGGEPMLNTKFIELLSKLLYERNIKFKGSITTNGTLLNSKTLDILYAAGVKSFQITIDGSKNLHNNLRISKSKNLDSYDTVCNALRTIHKSNYSDIICTVRINANQETIKKQNISDFLKDFTAIIPATDQRFLILPKPIGDYLSANLKGNSQATDTYCNKNSINEVVDFLERVFTESGYIIADPVMLTKTGGYSCYAGNANSFVINPDLKLFKCTVALDDPVNLVGYIDQKGETQLNSNISLWTKDYSNSGCTNCFAQNTCSGNSCPLINIKDNIKHCPPIKQEIEKITSKVVRFYESMSDAKI